MTRPIRGSSTSQRPSVACRRTTTRGDVTSLTLSHTHPHSHTLSLSFSHTLSLSAQDDATVKCWGYNNVGQLGLGDTSDRGDDPNGLFFFITLEPRVE